jgi:hypothetical protein
VKIGESKYPGLTRVRQQLVTAFPGLEGVQIFFHSEEAIRPDGGTFKDKDVHNLLISAGVEGVGGEWFAATPEEIQAAILALQLGHKFELSRTQSFEPRDEQSDAVKQTADFFRGGGTKYLWNAKMRFGKTFASYLLAEEMDWARVLVLTYKPAVKSAWKTDLITHTKFTKWHFLDSTATPEEAAKILASKDKVVWFASFQDITGKAAGGEVKPRNELIVQTDWDCLVIDEFHFGASTQIARELYDRDSKEEVAFAKHLEGISGDSDKEADTEEDETSGLKCKFQLHLSGTPYKAMLRGDYNEDQIFEWTYTQEQMEKERRKSSPDNQYAPLPTIQIFNYTLDGELLSKAIEEGLDEFSLRHFFSAKKVAADQFEFERPDDVDRFLNLIRGVGVSRLDDEYDAECYPYSGNRFSDMVRDSVWLMSNVAQCQAMFEKLTSHPYFSQFTIHRAFGTKAGVGAAALPPLRRAITLSREARSLGTITLSCGKLMTGVTVKEWGSIFMLTTLKAPESYFQAAFRVQSPWVEYGKIRKPECCVFEFDPNRGLSLVASYGSQVALNSKDQGVTQTSVLRELVTYLPIYSVADGQMEKLDAESLLEWVNTGITSNSLARKIMSPANFNLDSSTLRAVLADEDLMSELNNMDDFRDFYSLATKSISSSDRIKKLKDDGGPKKAFTVHKNSLIKQRGKLRDKLRKLNAKLTLFMYLTDFREEKLEHVVETLDSRLFTLATGMSLTSFRKLTAYGVFRPTEMSDVIQKYRYFEKKSLRAMIDGHAE